MMGPTTVWILLRFFFIGSLLLFAIGELGTPIWRQSSRLVWKKKKKLVKALNEKYSLMIKKKD